MYKTVKIAAIVVGAGTTGAVIGATFVAGKALQIADSNEIVANELKRMLSNKISDVMTNGLTLVGRKVLGPDYNKPRNYTRIEEAARLRKSSEYGRPTVAPIEREEKDI